MFPYCSGKMIPEELALNVAFLLRRVRELEERIERLNEEKRRLNLDVKSLREANVVNHKILTKQDTELFELRKLAKKKKKKAKRTNP